MVDVGTVVIEDAVTVEVIDSGCDVLIFRVGDISKGMEEGDSNSSREVVLDI